MADNCGHWPEQEIIPPPVACTAPSGGEVTPPPVVVPLASQPCIAINGVVDDQVMIVLVDGVPTYYNASGLVNPATVQVLDSCDPRCTPCECGEVVEDCCDCECTETQLADLVTMYATAVGV